jgi:hypothetical protein
VRLVGVKSAGVFEVDDNKINYHRYEMVFDPTQRLAKLLVDGNLRAGRYVGVQRTKQDVDDARLAVGNV